MKTCFDHNFSKSANPDILQKPLIVARFPLFEYAFTTTRAHERAEKSKLSARPKNAAAPSLLVIFSIEPLRIKKKKENLLYTVCTFLLLISTFSAQLGHDSSTLQGVHGKISETTFPADFAELWSKQVSLCFLKGKRRKNRDFRKIISRPYQRIFDFFLQETREYALILLPNSKFRKISTEIDEIFSSKG